MLIALPDLHGRSDLLEAAIRHYPSDARFVFLGDAIDRGPDSRGTVRKLVELHDAGRITLLCGNHEWMLLTAAEFERQARETGDEAYHRAALERFNNWERNGGMTVQQEFGGFGPEAVPAELLEYFSRLQLVFEGPGGYLCSHAAPPALLERYGSVEETILWARPTDGPFRLSPEVTGSVHGHTPLAEPTQVGKHLYLDLGAFITGALCTLDIEPLELIILQGEGSTPREHLPELRSGRSGLIRTQRYRVVEV